MREQLIEFLLENQNKFYRYAFTYVHHREHAMDMVQNSFLKALEQIVIYAMNKDIPYLAINVPNDTCLDCGYCDEFNNQCPECGSTNIQQLRRVTGYLTGNYKTAFNYGKQKETEARVKHTGNMEE